jgi:membrane peptidoglycan carboxypeptidase
MALRNDRGRKYVGKRKKIKVKDKKPLEVLDEKYKERVKGVFFQEMSLKIKSWTEGVAHFLKRKKRKGKKALSGGEKRINEVAMKNKKKKMLKKILGGVLVLIVLGFALFLATFVWFSKDLPSPEQIRNAQIAQTTEILDRNGNILYRSYGDENRTVVSLDKIPEDLREATIAVEDDQFYKHAGVDLPAVFRAVITEGLRAAGLNFKSRGGSTITQQLIKNTVVGQERSLTRKAKELILSLELERKLSKDQILELYLNQVPYGSQAFGVQAASQRYFGKNVEDLTLSESALLAGIPNAPSALSPHGANPDRAIARQQHILNRMKDLGYISQEEYDEAIKDDVMARVVPPSHSIKAPHFVFYVLELLEKEYGEEASRQEGLKVYTTLDLGKQEVAEEIVSKYAKINLEKYQANNMALVSIDPKTGQVLTFVGSKDYFDKSIQGQVSIPTSVRQPGSSFKPLVYVKGFEKGYNPRTILFDVSTDFGGNYRPKNYSGGESGPLDIKHALARSLNIPAVKMGYLVGVPEIINFARDLGYENFEGNLDVGLSLPLGSREVRLLDHTSFYAALANEGEMIGDNNKNVILKIEDSKGKILKEYSGERRRVFSQQSARWINEILSDDSIKLGANLKLKGRSAGAKTGTTNDNFDTWVMGYTPELATGVWVGNTDYSETKNNMTGEGAAAPTWKEYMERVLAGVNPSSFEKAEISLTGKSVLDGKIPEETVRVCKSTGKLATPETPESQIEEKVFKTAHSILYYVDKKNPKGPSPTGENTDPQFNKWEEGVRSWVERNKGTEGFAYTLDSVPTELCDSHTEEKRPRVTILKPSVNQEIKTGMPLEVLAESSSSFPIKQVDFYFDGELVGTKNQAPYSFSLNVSEAKIGQREVIVRVFDEVDNMGEARVIVKVIKGEIIPVPAP